MPILVTGGAGFIGSAVCRHLIRSTGALVINVDKLTYAANFEALKVLADHPRYVLERCTGVDGFYGASSMERLPAERAITEQTRRFTQLTLRH